MKKTILFFTLCLSLSTVSTCVYAQNNISQTGSQLETGSDFQDDNLFIGMPNPFTVCSTMDEAKALLGFSLAFPDAFSEYPEETIQVLRDENMLEVMLENNNDQICIRKAKGSGDISGVYTEYNSTCTVTVEDQTVSLKGDDTIHLALWEKGDYTYSFYSTKGISFFSFIDLFSKIH